MQVTNNMVQNLAHLARLSFNEQEEQSIKNDLEKMIAFVEQLEEVNTTSVQPLLHMGDAVNVLRDDVVQGSVSSQQALLNAPNKDEQFFKVPKVIKK